MREDMAALSPMDPLWPIFIARLYHLTAHPVHLSLFIDCQLYDKLKDCAEYREAVREMWKSCARILTLSSPAWLS